MKECYLYKKLKDRKVQCQTCAHYCLIEKGERGKCGVRENRNGKLFSLVYSKPCALHVDPIEKKPFFHFLPGTQSLSIATVGCNFACHSCQNWQISQSPKSDSEEFNSVRDTTEFAPERIVEMALKNELPSISYTYTEPTVFLEYALDTMKLAKKQGLKNNWVTNGFMSKQAFELISPYLDAANVDLKGFSDEFYQKYCGGRLQPVLDTLKRLKAPLRLGSGQEPIWVEVTTLVIPGLNDSKKVFQGIAEFIKKELGPETPWHISQFSGKISWKLQNVPNTPLATMQNAYEIGKEAGLKYVYTGNVPGTDSEDTYCSECSAKMIERSGYSIIRYDENGKCPKCKTDLNLILK